MPRTPEQNRAHVKRWQKANRDKYNKRMRTWRAANRKKVRAYERNRRAEVRAADPHAATYANRVRTLKPYGLTPESWDALFLTQGCRCAICGVAESGPRGWHTDHDDRIGKKAVRGILCVRCNIGLGQFRHNPEFLICAATYARHHEERLCPKANDKSET